jgi:hypothetical protein
MNFTPLISRYEEARWWAGSQNDFSLSLFILEMALIGETEISPIANHQMIQDLNP